MKKICLIAAGLVLCLGLSGFAGTVTFGQFGGDFNQPPQPRLRYPIYDTLKISAKVPLEFSWWNDFSGIRGFIFKIYKGYNLYAANLIYKENLPAGADSIKIKTDLFDDKQVYTWTLVQISFSGSKSDKSFNSFKVIKE